MPETRLIMGMPVTLSIISENNVQAELEKVFAYFHSIDERFSTYKETSEISKINRGEIRTEEYSKEMKDVFKKSEETKQLTHGYFDIIKPNGSYDPSGLVKGLAIYNAAKIIAADGYDNFFVDVAGDVQVKRNKELEPWSIGIRNPFKREENVKIVYIRNEGIATSGTYIRGAHIYNPLNPQEQLNEIVSLTVIGPNIYEADRFATAAFAMGKNGIVFIEHLPGFEAYVIDVKGIATSTTGFSKYTQK